MAELMCARSRPGRPSRRAGRVEPAVAASSKRHGSPGRPCSSASALAAKQNAVRVGRRPVHGGGCTRRAAAGRDVVSPVRDRPCSPERSPRRSAPLFWQACRYRRAGPRAEATAEQGRAWGWPARRRTAPAERAGPEGAPSAASASATGPGARTVELMSPLLSMSVSAWAARRRIEPGPRYRRRWTSGQRRPQVGTRRVHASGSAAQAPGQLAVTRGGGIESPRGPVPALGAGLVIRPLKSGLRSRSVTRVPQNCGYLVGWLTDHHPAGARPQASRCLGRSGLVRRTAGTCGVSAKLEHHSHRRPAPWSRSGTHKARAGAAPETSPAYRRRRQPIPARPSSRST